MKDFFISYNHADRQWAEWIAWHLEEAGYTAILQAWDFRPGSNFALEMHASAQAALRTIAVLSPDYLNAPYTLAEWASAFTQDPTSKKGKLLPIKVKECDPSGLLRQIICINIVGLSEDEARKTLLKGVSQERAKPLFKPTFPNFQLVEKSKSLEHLKSECIQMLHLSNPQFGCTNDEELHTELLFSLKKLLIKETLGNYRTNNVLISGDITFSGRDQEYVYAERLLKDFFDGLIISPSTDCFIVPGNHDVDWLSIGPVDDKIIDSLDSEEDIARLFSHPPTMELLSSRLGRFYDFTGKLLGRTKRWRRDRPWRVDEQKVGDFRIATLQLNSAWALGPKKTNPILGAFQVQEALLESEGVDLRVWVIHHGFSSLSKEERVRILSFLETEDSINIIYSGHHYIKEDVATAINNSQLYQVSSGPLFPGWHEPCCSVTKLTPNIKEIEIQFYRFDRLTRSWLAEKANKLELQPKQIKSQKSKDSNSEKITGNTILQKEKFVPPNVEASQKIDQLSIVSISKEQLDDILRPEKPILILTAVAVELKEVLSFLKPLQGYDSILRGHVGQETYYLGKYGSETAIVTMCGIGAIGRDAIILATQQAVNSFNPIAIIMIGIAFGKDRDRQSLGDVLVASQIVSYEQQRIGGEKAIHRGVIVQTGPVLLNRFRQALDWQYKVDDGKFAKALFGPVLSGEKLVDYAKYKEELFAAFPQAIGGEMEGAGLYAVAARTNTEWIIIKAICDWADGTKTDNYQSVAARAAASLAHYVLSDSTALETLKAQQSHSLGQ